jgi:hypothetical protein
MSLTAAVPRRIAEALPSREEIVALEKALSGGKREIDAGGLTLAPGFIDNPYAFRRANLMGSAAAPTCWHEGRRLL